MNPISVKVKKLKEAAVMPSYGHPDDAGLDLHALEALTIEPGEHVRIFVGIALEIPDGYVGVIKDKSSISNAGLHTMGGVFDSGYRGEYNVHLVNLADTAYTVEPQDKIAQLVILPYATALLIESSTLSETTRGNNGFGSTGKK